MTAQIDRTTALVAMLLIAAIPDMQARAWAVLGLLAVDLVLSWRALGKRRL